MCVISKLYKMMQIENNVCHRENGDNYKCREDIIKYLNSLKIVDLKKMMIDLVDDNEEYMGEDNVKSTKKYIRGCKKAVLISDIMARDKLEMYDVALSLLEHQLSKSVMHQINREVLYKINEQLEETKHNIIEEEPMINIDYIEAFNRGESDRLDQQQKFFQVEGQDFIRYTANGFSNNISFNLDSDSQGVINADQSTIVIDNITLYSSNPDLNRFFPLKIQFGNKREIEFDSVDKFDIVDYPVDLNISNGLPTLKTLRFSNNPTTNIIDTGGTTASNKRPLYTAIHKNEIYTSISSSDNYYITDTTTGLSGVILPTTTGNITDLKANDLIVVAGSATILKNLINSQIYTIGATNRAFELFDDNIALLVYDGEHRLRIINYSMNMTNRYTLVPNIIPALPASLYLLRKYRNDLYWFSLRDTFYRGDLIGTNVNLTNFVINKLFPVNVQILNFEYQDSIEQITCVVREVSATFFVEIYAYQLDVKIPNTAIILKQELLFNYQDTVIPDLDTSDSKTYRNFLITKMPGNSSILFFVNIIDFSIIKLDLKDYYDLNGITTCFAISDNIFTSSALLINTGVTNNYALTAFSKNLRPTNVMYKYTAQYFERIFEYDTTKISFDIFILERKIEQLEIFKIVMDYRLRYSKEQRKTDGQAIKKENIKKLEEGKKNKRRDLLKGFFKTIPQGTALNQIIPLGEPYGPSPEVGN